MTENISSETELEGGNEAAGLCEHNRAKRELYLSFWLLNLRGEAMPIRLPCLTKIHPERSLLLKAKVESVAETGKRVGSQEERGN